MHPEFLRLGEFLRLSEFLRKGAALFLLLLLCLAPNIQAADAAPDESAETTDGSPDSAPEPSTEPSTEPAGPRTGAERRRAGDKGGVFRPSEDISEDLAITFPVDI